MTIVTNIITDPAENPVKDATVRITLITGTNAPGYTSSGEVQGTYSVSTDATGTWTANLTPNSAITPANTYYQVVEGRAVSNISVPATGGPYLLGSILVVPPATPGALGITGVQVAANGTIAGSRPEINLIPGANLTATAADNPANNRVDLTISAPAAQALILPSGDTTGTTDAAAINAAITAANAAGGGTVTLAAGTFYCTKITLQTNVLLRGTGRNSTVVQLAASVNDNLIETTSFATLTGTNTTATPYDFGVADLTLDGNKSGQTTGTSHCLAIYGYGYRISAVTFRNARSWGLWTEWGSASNFLTPDGMEAFVTDVKIHDTDAGALTCIGPHDSQFVNVIICKNSGYQAGQSAINIPTDGRANGCVFTGVHVYGGAYDYGLTLASSGLLFTGCQFEGALVAQTQILSSINMLVGCKWFWGSAGNTTAKGVILGNASNTNINSIRLHGKIENLGGGTLDLTYAGGGNFYDVAAVYVSPFTVPSPTYAGSFNAQDTVNYTVINNAGSATSDSFLQTPVLAKTPALTLAGTSIPSSVDTDPLGYGYATTHPWNATANGAAALFAANAALYQQLVGYGMSTNQLRFFVGTSSGNISAGLYNNGGQAGSSRLPNARQATTGAIACPASGMATVTLTTTVTIGRSWYAALSCDNTTATFQRSAPQSTISNGVAANQGTAHPLPATAGAANGGGTLLWMATP